MQNGSLEILLKHIETIKNSKTSIIERWINHNSVVQMLSAQGIDKKLFKDDYGYPIIEYFIGVIEGKESIGQCPAIINLLEFFKSKNITTSELYTVCIHFRESMVREFFQKDLINETIYNSICDVFDTNFNGVLKTYSQSLLYAKQETEEFRNLVDNSLNEIYIFDTDTLMFTYVNRGAVLNTGYSVDELKQMSPHNIKPDFTPQKFKELITPLLEHKEEQLVFETIHERKDGSHYNVEVRLQLMSFNGQEKFVAIINDISERVKAVEAKNHFHKMATHDHLTKIYNRQKFDSVFKNEVERSLRYKQPLSLIMFDIDNFKHINDTYGHDVGDKVLIEITKVVSLELRESDTFARWGGEEFIVLLPQTELDSAKTKAEELRKKIESASIDEVGNITCCFGVTEMKENKDINQVFKEADSALYKAKSSGKNIVKSHS